MSHQICHIGVGNFHRSHQAVYLHKLLQSGECEDWGICGIFLMPQDQSLYETLKSQDGLYSVWELDNKSINAEIIGSVMRLVNAIDNSAPALDALCEPSTRIVSLTITEKGYYLTPDSTLDIGHTDIRTDLSTPEQPRTAIGLLVAAIRYRAEMNLPPFTVVSCDNIRDNGHKLRRAVIEFASQLDTSLAAWITENIDFPLSMVDRITPTPTTDRRNALLRGKPFIDDALVYCEPWKQWVIEDTFTSGRPPLEKAGVIFTDQVPAYEAMKVSLLNGGHSVLTHRALRVGFEFTHDAASDPTLSDWLWQYWIAVIETLEPISNVDYIDYCHELIRRFRNAALEDKLLRLAEDSSKKIQECIIPVLKQRLSLNKEIDVFTKAIAQWVLFLAEGQKEQLRAYTDSDKEFLIKLAKASVREKDCCTFITFVFGEAISLAISNDINRHLVR